MRFSSVSTVCLLIAAASGCGRDYDLGRTTTTGAGGGTTGTGSSSSSSATSTSSGTGTGAGGSGEGGAGGESSTSSSTGSGGSEPAGPTRLTIVNGVNDYEAIRLCFIPYPGGDPALKPWPSTASGLGFAKSAVIDPISDAVPAGTDVRPHIIAGDLAQTANKTCDQIVALGGDPASGVIVTPMAIIPAPVFDSKKSLLFAPMGCLGGPGHDNPSATLGCGFQYTPNTPTASLVLLAMSRQSEPGLVSLQAVNAAPPLQPTDLRVAPGFDGAMEQTVAYDLALGGITPKPPFTDFALADLGPLSKVQLRTYPTGQDFATSTTPLSEALANGALDEKDIADGKGYVLVAVGAYPGVGAGAFWHELTWTMVRAAP